MSIMRQGPFVPQETLRRFKNLAWLSMRNVDPRRASVSFPKVRPLITGGEVIVGEALRGTRFDVPEQLYTVD